MHWQSGPESRGATRRACGKYRANSAVTLKPALKRKKGVTFATGTKTPASAVPIEPSTTIGTAKAAQVVGFESDPVTIEEAFAREDAQEWEKAVKSELGSHEERGTWSVGKPPVGTRLIGCKWVLQRKRSGSHKARLVAKGFSQKEGIDYEETFAPVSHHATLRTFLSIVADHNLVLKQIDIKTAFLYGDLDEVIYMQHPPGFPGPPGTACLLHKSIYGLKQANRQWHLKFKSQLLAKGFVCSEADPALFIKKDKDGTTLALALVYVDDCLIAGSSTEEVSKVIKMLSQVFEVKELGEPSDFLGIQIYRDLTKGTLHIHQSPYILKLLDDYGLTGTTPKSLPSSAFSEGTPMPPKEAHKYPALVGSLMHLANCTRPDIAHLVGALARHLKAPLTSHWQTALNLLKYLSGTIDLALVYGTDKGLTGYVDSDFAGDRESRRSTTGMVFVLNGAAITWQSKLQPTVSLSTTEAEYQAAGVGARDALWLRKLLPELGVPLSGPIQIRGDNEGALCLLKNHMSTQRSKHIDVVHHFARERVEMGQIVYEYIPSKANIADILTKPLVKEQVVQHVKALGLLSPSAPLK
jgi:hypothetical protein